MRGRGFEAVRQISVRLGLGLAVLIATSSAALALNPMDNMSCPGAPITVPGLTTVAPSAADNVNIAAGQSLLISVTGGASGTIVRTDTNVTVLNLFLGQTTATISGPVVVTLDTPNIGGGGGLFSAAPGSMDITFSCIGGAQPPTTGTPGTLRDAINGARVDQLDRNRYIFHDLASNIFDVIGNECQPPLIFTRGAFEDAADGYADDLATYNLGGPIGPSIFGPDAEQRWAKMAQRLRCEYDALVSSRFYDEDDPPIPPPPGDLGQSVGDGWTLKKHLDFGSISRWSNGSTRQTSIGSLSMLGIRPFGDDMAVGVGVKGGVSQSINTNPNVSVLSQEFGADLFLAKVDENFKFAVTLGGAYVPGTVTQGNQTGRYDGFLGKVGGEARADFSWNEIDVQATLTALAQFGRYNAFDLGGTQVPATDVFVLDVAAGKQFSRDFYDPEKDMTFTPFIGGNLLFNHTSVSPAFGVGAAPIDPIRGELFLGGQWTWGNGMALGAQLDITGGPTSLGAGASVNFHAPIETLTDFWANGLSRGTELRY